MSVSLRPSVAARKRAAIRCFTSQLEPRGSGAGPVLTPATVAHFTRDHEVLLRGGPMSLGPGYFDQMYAAAPDPWGLASRWYEARKYALTLALLPDPRYRDAFEPGCSVGVLTGMLAARCGPVLAWDASAAAVRAAAGRTAALPNVRVRAAARSPATGRPAGSTSSCSPRCSTTSPATSWTGSWIAASRRCGPVAPCSPCTGGTRSPTTRGTATTCTGALAARRDLARRVGHTEADFTAEVYQRAGREPVSVAQAEGLV